MFKEKINTFSDIQALFKEGAELAFIRSISDYHPDMLLWKKNPDPTVSKRHLEAVKQTLLALNDNEFTSERIKESAWKYAEEHGKGDVLWPLRVALTGQEKSPDPFTSAALVGKYEAIERITAAIKKLS